MAVTRVGVIYSVAQRSLRRYVMVDDDAQLLTIQTLPGEKLIFQPLNSFVNRGPEFAVRFDSGGPPLSNRCAVIFNQNNRVISHIYGDPNIDSNSFPFRTLIQSDISKIGDLWRPALRRFQRRYILLNSLRKVTSVVNGDPENPPAPDASDGFVEESDTANIGDQVGTAGIVGCP